jgi:signal recognition particle receptor subunit beta
MVSINYAFKEICCKIVYYGPGLSGKTTNLQWVHQKIPTQTRGELISLATDQDRTLYFDFLPVDIGQIHGFSIKFQLYTVPGQVYYNATRKLVLRGVDGLVFVADSQRSKMDENIESYRNLVENLEGYGYDVEKLPLVLQYNKRDLPQISSVDELESILNPRGLPHFETVAMQGMGVFDTLKCISKLVLDLAKGRKVVPEREALVKEAIMAEARLAPPERATDSQGLKTETSMKVFPEGVDLSKEKKAEPIPEEKSEAFSEETKFKPPPPEKREGFETEKEKVASEEFVYDREEKKMESEPSSPQAGEGPTIISWSAFTHKKKSEPRGFFLWRFLKKLLNR